MGVSQFKIYMSNDATGPGPMTGEVGKLLTILDACLVDGYTGHAAAGWSKPIANSGNCGCYQMGAGGTDCVLFVNDNGPNVTSTYKEAWITGWETIAGIAAPVGSGTGQFPLPAQLLTTGHAVVRKSATADTTIRQWIIYADATTFYMFIETGDATGTYHSYSGWGFGDYYSLNAAVDIKHCILMGRAGENVAGSNQEYFGGQQYLTGTISILGHYCPRPWGGVGGSVAVTKTGDIGKATFSLAPFFYFDGMIQTPNGPDNALHMSPVWVADATNTLRGRLRGFYQLSHPKAQFSDGYEIDGAGDLAGKTFKLVSWLWGYNNNTGADRSGHVAMETSATVETN